MKKKLVLGGILLGLAAITAVGVTQVKADDESMIHPFAQKIAERFGLNQDEVEEFVDGLHQERRQEMEQEREQRQEEYYQGLVDDGTLTQEQVDALRSKLEEMRQNEEPKMDGEGRPDPEEMEAKMEEHRAEMEAWAEENGIDLSLIHPERPEDGQHRMGGWRE